VSIADKAIAEYPWWQSYHNDTILESQYRELIKASNCDNLQCLRKLPYDTLATAIQAAYTSAYRAGRYGFGDHYYGPSVDGSVIRDLPSNEFEQGHFCRVPLLTDRETYEGESSSFANDGTISLTHILETGALFTNISITNTAEINPDLQKLWPAAETSFFTRLNQLYPLSAFTGSYFDNPFFIALGSLIPTLANNSPFWKLSAIFGDFIINCPTYYMGAAFSHAGLPIWKMVFNAGDKLHDATAPYLLGIPGNVTSFIQSTTTASNATLATIMKEYFLSFATELDPNAASFSGVGRPYWPQYQTPACAYRFAVLEVNDTTIGTRPDPDASARCDFFHAESDVVRN
jgi:carboxylesterase type B